MDISNISSILNPDYSFAVRHPVYSVFTVNVSEPLLVALPDYTPNTPAIELGWTYNTKAILCDEHSCDDMVHSRACTISQVHEGVRHDALLLLPYGPMLNEYRDLVRKNVHNVVLVVCASGVAFAVGNVT